VTARRRRWSSEGDQKEGGLGGGLLGWGLVLGKLLVVVEDC
jgi:hypothetical protein